MEVTELVGVYAADGGVLGELRYVWGKVRGTAHCGLCDLTHSGVRRRPAWDALVERLGLRVTLLHLNELDLELTDAVRTSGAPVLLARTEVGLETLMNPSDLDEAHGSVEAFAGRLEQRFAELGD